MKIAILGWGSLIWNQMSLKIENKWHNDGPLLPIEFSRISNDGRLTIVIDTEKGSLVQTLYAFSKYQSIDEAVLDLSIREGCGKNKIGYLIKQDIQFSPNINFQKYSELKNKLQDWINNKEIDAIIWTQLSPNHKDKLSLETFTHLDAISYLKYLPSDIQAKAEEYIRKTPTVVKTPIRDLIEEELKWMPIQV